MKYWHVYYNSDEGTYKLENDRSVIMDSHCIAVFQNFHMAYQYVYHMKGDAIITVGSQMTNRVWLVINHLDTGETESYDMTNLYSWGEIIKDHLLAPTYNYQWIIYYGE